MEQTGAVVPAGRVTDLISLGVLASYVSRDAVDEAIEESGKAAKCFDGTIPPHVVVYFTMALALFAEEDYEEVAQRLAGVLADWGAGWDPTSGGLTKARKRLGVEPMVELFSEVARPVAEEDTAGAFFGPWRVMSLDGMVFDVERSEKNLAAFGLPGTREGTGAALPQVRAVTVDECGSHAPVLAARRFTQSNTRWPSLSRSDTPTPRTINQPLRSTPRGGTHPRSTLARTGQQQRPQWNQGPRPG